MNSGDPWVICAINETSAWVSASDTGLYQADDICNHLGFTTVAAYGGTCGNVCGYCEGPTSCESPGTKFFSGSGGSDFPELGSTVHWLCTNT